MDSNFKPVGLLRLSTLGLVELRSGLGSHDEILAQPKRVGLLVYLVAAIPHHLHRRDELLAVFWPELDREHARNALCQGVRALRAALGNDVIARRGKEELGVRTDRIWCDAITFERHLAAGRFPKALSLYRGPFLTGFFLSHAPDFERWVEGRRQDLQRNAIDAALATADHEEANGDLQATVRWLRWAAQLNPTSERIFRRLMALLNRMGDRAEAVKAYEAFAERLRRDYDLKPSPQTSSLLNAIRSR